MAQEPPPEHVLDRRDSRPECMELPLRCLPSCRALVGARKMGVDTRDAECVERPDDPSRFGGVSREESQPPHTGVDFEVDVGLPAACLCRERLCLHPVVDGQRQMLARRPCGKLGRHVPEDEDRRADARASECECLVRRCHREVVRAEPFVKRPEDGGAVPVGVCLDDTAEFCLCSRTQRQIIPRRRVE